MSSFGDPYRHALTAYLHGHTPCPICGEEWLCGYDVEKRQPFLIDGVLRCSSCVAGSSDNVTDWLMARVDLMSDEDRQFVLYVQGLDLGDLNQSDLTTVGKLMEYYGNNDT